MTTERSRKESGPIILKFFSSMHKITTSQCHVAKSCHSLFPIPHNPGLPGLARMNLRPTAKEPTPT